MSRRPAAGPPRDIDPCGGVPRFYLPPENWPRPGGEARLDGQEAAHCRVLRLTPGDGALLLDGRGRIGRCRVLSVGRKDARLELLDATVVPQPAARAVMALAFSKAVRRGFFMEKAVELGAAGVWLWQGDHSQGRLTENAEKASLGQMIAGAKQCANPWLPEVRALAGIDAVVALSAGADWRILPWEMQAGVPMLMPGLAGRAGVSVYVIGPEGGFSARELAALREAEFTPVSLGHRILRCETAAALTLGLHWWASQLPGGPDFRPDFPADFRAAAPADTPPETFPETSTGGALP